METALAIVIVSTGVLAILYAQQAYHQQNYWSSRAATGTFLANEIREMTRNLPRYDPVTGNAFWGPESDEFYLTDFDDLDDFDGADGAGVIFSAQDESGPLNAMREIIPNMDGWAQTVTAYNVETTNINAPGDEELDGTTQIIRMEVVITHQLPTEDTPNVITTLTWISSR